VFIFDHLLLNRDYSEREQFAQIDLLEMIMAVICVLNLRLSRLYPVVINYAL